MLYRSTRRKALSASTALNYGVLTLLARPECACRSYICPGHLDAARRKSKVSVARRGGETVLLPFQRPGMFAETPIVMGPSNDNVAPPACDLVSA